MATVQAKSCHPFEEPDRPGDRRTPNSADGVEGLSFVVLGPWKSRSGARAVCGLERCATTATARTQGISNPEARTRQALFIVDHAVIEPFKAAGIDKESRIVSFDDEVIGSAARRWSSRTASGTSPFSTERRSPDVFVSRPLSCDEGTELRGGVGGEFNHIPSLRYDFARSQMGARGKR